MTKKLSKQTREKMAQSARDRWASSEEREKQSERASMRRGLNTSQAKTWSLLNPDGKKILTSSCKEYCKKQGISYSALKRKAYIKDTTEVTRGISKGWRVILVTEMIRA